MRAYIHPQWSLIPVTGVEAIAALPHSDAYLIKSGVSLSALHEPRPTNS